MREARTLGRPREFDADEALARILDVFWAKGFEGSSMSDLVTATGLKKGSLYAAFGDKRSMYLEALALYERSAIQKTVRLLTGGGAPEQRIADFFQLAIDAVAIRQDRRGCFLCNASVDQAVLDPETEQVVQQSFTRFGRALEVALSELVGASTDEKWCQAEAQHLLSVYFGLRVLAKGGHSVKSLKDAKEAALSRLSPPESR